MLSPLAFWLGLSGLLPFLIGPLWLTLSPATAPVWLDLAWHRYIALIASFMAGTFWGFAVPLSRGTAGMMGVAISVALMLLSWAAMALPFRHSLLMLGVVFLLLLLADYWRDRALDSIEGYFRLRAILTAGVLLSISWRLLLKS
ncbi:MAG: DUF3429 domain-containing protein [Pseudomonadota bacterium]